MDLTLCSYCTAPMAGAGLFGRAKGDRPPPSYCCSGCLSLGERGDAGQSPLRLDPRWIRVAVSIVLAAQTMALGLAINLTPPIGPARLVLQTIVLATTLVVLVLLSGPLIAACLGQLKRGELSADALFFLGIVGALVASIQSMVRGQGPIYFEVVSVLLLVHTLNKLLGAAAARLLWNRPRLGRIF